MSTMANDPLEQLQDHYSVVNLTDKDMESVQYQPQPSLSTCTDPPVNGQSTPELAKQSASAYSSGAVNLDIEKGNHEKVKIIDEIGWSMKSEMALTKALRRQNSLQPAKESAQPLMSHILMLLKLDAKDKQAMERAHEASTNKWRKYKRPALFDSRQIVLLFSIMSSMGSIVLIYLTLRIRQAAGEGFVHM